MFLIGFGVGCLITGPFSEIFGRFAVYTGSLTIFAIWVMAAALAPNFGAQLVFRTLAGLSASTPLTCVGGTISDLYNSLEKTWAFPLYAVGGFGGPLTGLVMVSYVGPTIGWRWAEWVSLLATGVVLALVILFMPETFAPILLERKAKHLRKTTGDERYRSPHEMAHITAAARLKIAMTRPFLMATEPIIMLWTLYLTIIYIILFTFLDGYPYIYQETYGISQGLTNVIFIAMDAGVASILVAVPFIYRHTAHKIKAKQSTPEVRLWYAMIAAPTIPISLFWMGWTARPSISIWSPMIASFLFGYGTTGVFISTYMYIIDSYEMYSASALTFVAVVRYIAAGGMTVAGLPIYEGLGVAYTCTILACASAVMVPVPYVLYRYGRHVRSKSKFAVSSEHE